MDLNDANEITKLYNKKVKSINKEVSGDKKILDLMCDWEDAGGVIILEAKSINSVWISNCSCLTGAIGRVLGIYKRYFKGCDDVVLRVVDGCTGTGSINKVQRAIDSEYWRVIYKRDKWTILEDKGKFINLHYTTTPNYATFKVSVVAQTARYKKYRIGAFDTEKAAKEAIEEFKNGDRRVVIDREIMFIYQKDEDGF